MPPLPDNLLAALDAGRMPHACFFCSTDDGYAEAMALSCAARYLGVAEQDLSAYPDFHDISCPVAINELRALLAECAKRTFHEGGRCVRFTAAHLMSELCQDLLLKTLEEPPPRTLFLLCGHREGMLPTVRSRCAAVRLGTPSSDVLYHAGAPEQMSRLYANIADSLAEARRLCTDEAYRARRQEAYKAYLALLSGTPPFALAKGAKGDKTLIPEVLAFWLSFSRDLLSLKVGGSARNSDLKELSHYAGRFTTGRINCMIEWLTEAAGRLHTHASAGATFDALVTRILEE